MYKSSIQVVSIRLLAYMARNPAMRFIVEVLKRARFRSELCGIATDVKVHALNDLEPALAAVKREHAGALNVQGNAVTNTYRAEIVDFTVKNRLPSMYGGGGSVEIGGLMSYGPNPDDLYRRAATYLDKILKGAKPADLPSSNRRSFEFVINRKTQSRSV